MCREDNQLADRYRTLFARGRILLRHCLFCLLPEYAPLLFGYDIVRYEDAFGLQTLIRKSLSNQNSPIEHVSS